MTYQIGQTIKTVYGEQKIAKVNKSSVTIKFEDGKTMKITNKQVEIMN